MSAYLSPAIALAEPLTVDLVEGEVVLIGANVAFSMTREAAQRTADEIYQVLGRAESA